MNKQQALKAGLIEAGKNEEGEQQFIGTRKEWNNYEKSELEICSFCNGMGELELEDHSTIICTQCIEGEEMLVNSLIENNDLSLI